MRGPFDWSKSDLELATETGYHRNAINKLRKKLGRPLPDRATNVTSKFAARANWNWLLSNRKLARRHRVLYSSVQASRMRLRAIGIDTRSLYELLKLKRV